MVATTIHSLVAEPAQATTRSRATQTANAHRSTTGINAHHGLTFGTSIIFVGYQPPSYTVALTYHPVVP